MFVLHFQFEKSEAATSFGNSGSDDDSDCLPDRDDSQRDLQSSLEMLQPDETSCTQQDDAASGPDANNMDEHYRQQDWTKIQNTRKIIALFVGQVFI